MVFNLLLAEWETMRRELRAQDGLLALFPERRAEQIEL
jgi:hypothetical protein